MLNVLTLCVLAALAGAQESPIAVQPASPCAAGAPAMAEGHQAATRGDWVAARKSYGTAVQLSPGCTEVFYSLGLASRNLGLFDEAAEAYQSLLKLSPGFVDAYYNLGLARASARKWELAVDAYRLALQGSPGFAQGHCAMAIACRELKRPAEGLLSIERAIELERGYAGAWNVRGNIHVDLHDYLEAEKDYQKAVEAKPDYVNAWYNLGLVRHYHKRDVQARRCFERCLALNARFNDARIALALSHRRARDFKGAELWLRQALEVDGDDLEARDLLARLLDTQGRKAEARRERTRAREIGERLDREGSPKRAQGTGLEDIQEFVVETK